ncbi:MAG: rubredoxin [Firmicutes bacterium]|nr:rubredoxin [Bacillota bacterium]
MKNFVCSVCGYVYEQEQNENIPFEQLPDDWCCPLCGVGKEDFEEE